MRRFRLKPDLSQLSPDERRAVYESCRRRWKGSRRGRWVVRLGRVMPLVGMMFAGAVWYALRRHLRPWERHVVAALLGLAAGAALAWFWGVVSLPGVREELRRRGRCPNCGYDLTASPERCPECGAGVTPGVGAS